LTLKNNVFILGMHRSGTSFLARALNLSGLYLGPASEFYDTEIEPVIGNPRGHWENANISKTNENILQINNASWDNIPSEITKTPNDFEKKIKQIQDSFYNLDALAYGFKDPRFTITLEKWIPHFPKFVIIGIFRHPLKVAESLKLRNNFEYKKSILLWQNYNKYLLDYLKKYQGFLINFDWPREKLLNEISLVSKRIGLYDINFDSWFSEELKISDQSYDKSHELPDEAK